MRKIKRNMARVAMKDSGLARINKKRPSTKENEKPRSYFARNWRRWIFGNPAKAGIKDIMGRKRA